LWYSAGKNSKETHFLLLFHYCPTKIYQYSYMFDYITSPRDLKRQGVFFCFYQYYVPNGTVPDGQNIGSSMQVVCRSISPVEDEISICRTTVFNLPSCFAAAHEKGGLMPRCSASKTWVLGSTLGFYQLFQNIINKW
jgi:hypothetical protein